VPTSAHSGDGMGNLLALVCELCQTWLAKKISYSEELHSTVMEVRNTTLNLHVPKSVLASENKGIKLFNYEICLLHPSIKE